MFVRGKTRAHGKEAAQEFPVLQRKTLAGRRGRDDITDVNL